MAFAESLAPRPRASADNAINTELERMFAKRMGATTSEVSSSYRVSWDGRTDAGLPVSTGVYLYRLETMRTRVARKMMLIR